MASAVKEHHKKCRVTTVHWAVGGIACLLACAVAGVIFSVKGANGADGAVKPRPTASQLEQIGAEPALLTKPWEPANTQWLLGAVMVATFALRRYALPVLVRRLYAALPPHKQIKIANYMLELIGTSLALVFTSAGGLWTLLFDPSAYDQPSVQQKYQLAVAMQLLFACFIPMYVMELAFDGNMRAGLALHHWTSIILALWGSLMLYDVELSPKAVRTFFALSLYMSTEQNVFVEMLAYHRQLYWPTWYTLSAWYYLVSRVVIAFLSLWSWWGCYEIVFRDGAHNSSVVYALWLFVPPANIILNATQLTTVISLFGIASTVRKRLQNHHEEQLSVMKEASEEGRQDMTSTKSQIDNLRYRSKLYDVFSQIDSDDSGYISLDELRRYVKSLDLDLILPTWAIVNLYNCIDLNGIGEIDSVDFERFFCGFSVPSTVDFKSVLMGALIKSMLQADIDRSYRAVLLYKYQSLLDTIQHQCGRTLGSAWALLPRVGQVANADVFDLSMSKSLTEPAAFSKSQRRFTSDEPEITTLV